MKRTYKEALDAYNTLLEARDNAKNKAASDGFDKLSVEERAAITNYDNDHVKLLEEVNALKPDTRNLNVNTGVVGNRDLSPDDVKNFEGFRLTRAFRALAENKPFEGIEKEIHEIGVEQSRSNGLSVQGFAMPDMSEFRGQTVTGQTSATGDQGGLTVPTVLGGLIEQFWSKSVLDALDVTKFTGLSGNVTFPVQSTKLAAVNATEIEALSDQEVLFTNLAMTPNRRGITVPYSKQLLLQTSLSVESFLRDQFLMAFGAKADVEAITKILAAVSSPVLGGTNGLAPVWSHIVDLETNVAANDADQGALAYLTNAKVRGKLKKTEKFGTTNGNAIWENGSTPLNNYNAVVSNYVPSNLTKGSSSGVCSAITFGNFKDLYIGQWGVIDFVVDPYSKKKTAQIEITANTFWDIQVARAASFSAMKDALTV